MANHCIMANQGRTGEHYRTKLYKLDSFGPKIGNTDGHNGPKINMMEAEIYDA